MASARSSGKIPENMTQKNSFNISKFQLGILALSCALALNCSVAARAQEPRQDVEPDRPDITNGTHIVDIGLLQIELGGLLTRAAPDDRQLGTPFTARVGLFEWLEARFGTDGLLTQ